MIALLSQLIDMRAFYERHGVTVVGKPTNSRNDGKEWHGSCPRCGGTDRFLFWESGRYSCSARKTGCGLQGSSPYWFLREVEGFNHYQACDELGIDPHEFGLEKSDIKLPLFLTRDEPPCRKWQEAAEAFVYRAHRYLLYNPNADRALTYLQSRGLTEATIKQARLGFCPGWYKESLEVWGLSEEQTDKDEAEIRIPEGIILPWVVQGAIWKLSVRRPTREYFQVLGSSDALYNVDSIRPGQPVFLFESEFDALSIEQEAGDLATAVATGSASKGLTGRWLSRILPASYILQSFDGDDAGENGAAEWLKCLPPEKTIRWRPWAHDGNDMLRAGMPVRLWVEMGVRTAQIEVRNSPTVEVPITTPEVPSKTPEIPIIPPALALPTTVTTATVSMRALPQKPVLPPRCPQCKHFDVRRSLAGNTWVCMDCPWSSGYIVY